MIRILFVSDIHGSERCFKKFLNAAIIYKANIAMLSGDITSKMIVPIVKQPNDVYTAEYLGGKYTIKNEHEIETLKERIRYIGYIPYVTDYKEMEELQLNQERIDALFKELIINDLKRWLKLAEERLMNRGIKCFIMPGNDDIFEIDAVIEESDYVVNPEGKCIHIDEEHEMISTGYANITPWKCPRDIPEEELEEKIEDMVAKIENMETAIFCFHVPPYGTKLDQAPKLDEKLQIVIEGGHVVMIPAGSIAVRKAIEKYQPLLGLHGHIHESRAFDKIGRTMCFNPGSEYGEGIFHGALINIDSNKVKGYMLMTG